MCATEWTYGRIIRPACGEEAVEKLAIYTANQFQHVRVEACDTCRHYIKTVDLTKNGHAVPVVDELATMPLNLWAQEHGYVKLQPNLLELSCVNLGNWAAPRFGTVLNLVSEDTNKNEEPAIQDFSRIITARAEVTSPATLPSVCT